MLRTFVVLALLILPLPAMARDHCDGNLCFQKKARVECLRPEVWAILHKVAEKIGRIEVASGCDGRHARRSYHYSGQAVDFRPMQASSRAAVAVLRGLPEVGGIGTYGNGLVHADTREQRFAWHGSRRARGRSARTQVAGR